MSEGGGKKSMENVEYRKREIEFTSLKNIITYCAMINQKSFDFYRMAEVLNTDHEFLRQWGSRNLWLINRVLREYREEITGEIKRRSAGGLSQGKEAGDGEIASPERADEGISGGQGKK